MSRHRVMGATKAEEIALTMRKKGYPVDDVESLTGVPRTRIDKLKAPMVHINRALVTGLLVEAYEIAENTNEIVNVAKELGKLHGLYEPEKTITINVDSGDITKQLQAMTTEELQRLLGSDPDTLIIEGEFSDAA